MTFLAAITLALVAWAATTINAGAQQRPLGSIIPTADPIAAADNEFGRAARQTLVEGLLANTEASCRQTQGLDNEALSRRLRDIFIVHGTMWNGQLWWTLLLPNFTGAFTKRAGDAGLAEWQRLLVHPDIRRLIAAQAVVRNNELTQRLIEDASRWMLLRRAPRNIVSLWDAVWVDKPHLQRILDADDQAEEKAVNAFLQSDAGALGKRYLELSKVYAEAQKEAFATGVTGLLTIGEFYPGITARLKTFCIPMTD